MGVGTAQGCYGDGGSMGMAWGWGTPWGWCGVGDAVRWDIVEEGTHWDGDVVGLGHKGIAGMGTLWGWGRYGMGTL